MWVCGFVWTKLIKEGTTNIILFCSTSVMEAQKNYSFKKIELVGSHFAVEKLRFYLEGAMSVTKADLSYTDWEI